VPQPPEGRFFWRAPSGFHYQSHGAAGPREPVGDKARNGAVKKRMQLKTKLGGAIAWTKRSKTSGESLAVKKPAGGKKAAKKIKGVRTESIGLMKGLNDDRSPLLDMLTCLVLAGVPLRSRPTQT